MSDAKHTPGPWETIHDIVFDEINIVDKDGCKVALSMSVDPEEEKANAHLIAAAPELLDALEEIERVDVKLPFWLLGQVKAAIAKAKGETR